MTGSIKHRGANRFALILDHGKVGGKRKQQWVSFRATAKGLREGRKEAEAALAKRLDAVKTGTFREPTTITTVEYLRAWLEARKALLRPNSYTTYHGVIENHVAKAPIASILLHQLRGDHVEAYYAASKAGAESLGVHAAVLGGALRKAVRDKLIAANPADDLERRTSAKDAATEARTNCWSAADARKVLAAAKKERPQLAAFVFLALDSGARKAELEGLRWTDLDLDNATLTIERQLDTTGDEPTFGPTKTKKTRVITLAPETITILRAHRQSQNELRMRNRKTYADLGLIFAREDVDLQRPDDALGEPLRSLGKWYFYKLVKAAGVKRIVFHGCRHTVASLSLGAGTPPHVVGERLGHSVQTLLKTYAHAMPDQQQDAAAKLGAVLHG